MMAKRLLYDGLGTVIDCMMAKRLLLLCENPKADCMMTKGLLYDGLGTVIDCMII